MRIVGGTHRRRNIAPPRNFRARPTTDFAKENLFNILNNLYDFEECTLLDLFSGTGSISYEFASRGARRVVSVELNPLHQKFIADTARELGFTQIESVRTNAFVCIGHIRETFDIIFADPPYDMEGIDRLPSLVFGRHLINEGGLFILEHSDAYNFEGAPHFSETRTYGSVHFSFFRAG